MKNRTVSSRIPVQRAIRDIQSIKLDVSIRHLREQREWLIKTYGSGADKTSDDLVRLLDFMIDKAEGAD